MQGEDPANARARQLLDSCSRTITVTRIQAGDGVNAFRAETSAFPELNASGAAVAAVALPAASDEFPTPFFNDGIKVPENFNVDGGEGGKKTCGVCFNDLIGDELGEALAVGQSVTLRQLMCTQLQPGTGARQPLHWLGGGHFFPHVYHGPCIEAWFLLKLQQHQPPACPHCKAVFSNQMAQPPHYPAPMLAPPVPEGPLVRMPHLHCPPHVGLCPRAYACAPAMCRATPHNSAHSRHMAPPERAAGSSADRCLSKCDCPVPGANKMQ